MKGQNKMKKFGYTLLLTSLLFLIGTIGGIEQGTMHGASGTIWSGICFVLMFVGTRIIEKEENRK